MIPPLPSRVQEAVANAEKKKTVKEIALACGVSEQTIYGWRRGGTINLKGETLVELAEVSGLNPRWIINGKGQKHGLTDEEKDLLIGFHLVSEDMRESWLASSRRAIARDLDSQKQQA
jgi:hypothetical protein